MACPGSTPVALATAGARRETSYLVAQDPVPPQAVIATASANASDGERAKSVLPEQILRARLGTEADAATFMAVLPADQPRYLVTIILDEPQPTPETKGYPRICVSKP